MDFSVISAIAFSGMITSSAAIYGWYKLLKEKINFKSYKIYLSLAVLVVLGTILNYAVPSFIKLTIILVSMLIINYYVISKDLSKCISSVIIVQGVIMISELVILLFSSIFIGNYGEVFLEKPIGIITINICVAILIILAMNLKPIHKLYQGLYKIFYNMKQNKLILCCLLTIILAIVFMIMGHMRLSETFMMIVGSGLIVFYVIIVIVMLNAQQKFQTVNSKYETSVASLKEYEDIMDRYRVDNHENKNQLLTIRNMIKANDKKTIDYIDRIVDNKLKDNETIFYKTSKIPEGGLRATIYSKISKMGKLKIKYVLDIANDVRTVDLIKLTDDTILNVCKIIGVFLDNAIEAVENLKKKEIIIEIYVMDSCLCIDISNTYKGNIEIDKISQAKYTTKGAGHGYGLTLVNKILKEDNNLENEKVISRELFKQRLKIKM